MASTLDALNQAQLELLQRYDGQFQKLEDKANALSLEWQKVADDAKKQIDTTNELVNDKIDDLDTWKNNLKVHQISYDYIFKKIIPQGTKLDGSVLWNTRDLDTENKSSYIILFDGANNASLKYGDGVISGGIYIGNISFNTAGKGGSVYGANVGFLYSHYGHTNNSLLEDLPIVRSSHAFNGAQVKVQARSLFTGNKYTQHNQILFYLNEGDKTASEDIEVTLTLKRII
ncbi:hypothetical protein [Hydrogenimonas thermophila]|uniref:DUF1983 domain-containing protein n=1 Tax=Hydrogenimonas thermophila TaxID=223786 RepID=A0A1I5RP21_9BACT|nr:hypothetical protein [Hydrogenimonas thermophila]SFP60314.1 hypothetical protein SAMN05216234_1287 [Hydrogenimonas thermophila]